MKTAISLPNETFDAAEKRAYELGLTRSEFFATAARRYLQELDQSSLTKQIDEALAHIDGDDSATAAAAYGGGRLAAGDDW